MDTDEKLETSEKEELLQEFPQLQELVAEEIPPEPVKMLEPIPSSKPDPVLQKELESALQRVQQLERERCLLSQGVPEEDLDYYVFKIGALVTPEKDFAAAAKDFLKARRSRHPGGISTAANLSTRMPKSPNPNETMNKLIRGN